MAEMSRRAVMAGGAGMALIPVGGASAGAAGDAVKAAPPEVTRILARYIVEARYDDLPANVRKEGVRTLLNYVGVAVGGSRALAAKSNSAIARCAIRLSSISAPRLFRQSIPGSNRNRST
jgi:hypothetical protein